MRICAGSELKRRGRIVARPPASSGQTVKCDWLQTAKLELQVCLCADLHLLLFLVERCLLVVRIVAVWIFLMLYLRHVPQASNV